MPSRRVEVEWILSLIRGRGLEKIKLVGSSGLSVQSLGGSLQPPTYCSANLVVPLNIVSVDPILAE